MNPSFPAAVIIALAVTLPYHNAWGERVWTPIGAGAAVDHQSIQRRPDGLIQAWQRDWLLPNVRKQLEVNLRNNGTIVDFSDYGYSITLWVYDCKKMRFAVASRADYSVSGEVINSFEQEPAFNSIIPDSVGEVTAKYICAYRGTNRK
jgi:hypothetical protein